MAFKRRRLNEILFRKWTPEMAYVLGQFKAGANFSINKKSLNKQQGYFYGITISTTNLQHLIKLQLLLGSDHKIKYDLAPLKKYKNGALRYILNIRNKYMLSDLRRLGFVSTQNQSAKNNAPFPEDIPDELLPHYLRGYFDERLCPIIDKKNGQPRASISSPTADFLIRLSEKISDKLGIPPKSVYTRHGAHKKLAKSFFIVYTGQSQLSSIFRYLYSFVPEKIYCVEKYHRVMLPIKQGKN